MSRRRASPAALRAAFVAALLGAAGCSGRRVVTLYHTGSIHGRIGPDGATGGFAALARAVNGSGPRLLVDAGNWFEGTPEGMLSRGSDVVGLMNEAGYDAAAAANQEFVFGQDNLRRLAAGAKFPVLASNLYLAGGDARPDYVKGSALKNVGGVTFGIFALVSPRLALMTNPRDVAGLRVRRPLDEAREQIEGLRKAGAEVVVALSHVGWERPDEADDGAPFEGDRFLAENLPGLDVLVGGRCPKDSPSSVRSETTGVLYVCTGGDLKEVGAVELSVTGGRVASAEARLVPLSAERGEDPSIKRLVEESSARADRELSVAVATAAVPLEAGRWSESALGDWAADCMRSRSGAELALLNSGALRSSLERGPVTRRDLFALMPFEDHLVVLGLTGRQIRDALEAGLSSALGRLQVSGLSVVYDPSAAPGRRLVSASGPGGPLQDARGYSVAVNEYLASGGDGFAGLTAALSSEDKGERLRDAIEACARKGASIKPPDPGRLMARRPRR